MSDIVIALAGNPNSGKTSLFNFITGSRQHVGNYPGVTVEIKEGTVPVEDVSVTFVDLPGTYSISPLSVDEKVARGGILDDRVSAIIVVADTCRLERSLYLFSQIMETGKPVVLALNMFDEFECSGAELDEEQLSSILGVPCVKTVGNRGKGVLELMSVVLKAVRGEVPARGKPVRYTHEMEHAIDDAVEVLRGRTPWDERWTAVNVLTFGRDFIEGGKSPVLDDDVFTSIDGIRERLEALEGRSVGSIATAGRYGFASGALMECLREPVHQLVTTSDKIDAVLTHRWLGLPIFVLILWVMFQATFTIGDIPSELIARFFTLLGDGVSALITHELLRSLLVDGIIAGVGGVLVFLPIILVLFFFISILEDTGYMARAAFIMDRIMHFLGLHGKSFLPMLIGFGCTVPAIMATRIIENRRERLITMFILPFMSCGARLPVYVLLAGAFFGNRYAGSVIFSLYIVGILLSFIIAKLASFINPSPSAFVMELPPYRIPTVRSVLLHIWERTYLYVRKAGTVILAASVVLWVLVTFPRSGERDGAGVGETSPDSHAAIAESYAGTFGRAIEPALKPLGFDWRIGVSLVTGFAAKEVIVSTLATIYAVDATESPSGDAGLRRALRDDPMMSPIKAYGLMLFILIYVPCVAVLGVLRREAGGWLWVALMIVYTIGLAWLVSFSFISVATLLTS